MEGLTTGLPYITQNIYAHLKQVTRLGRKSTNVRAVKRHLQVCNIIGKGGLLVVRREYPFAQAQNLTVIPGHLLHCLVSALHLQLQHPTKSQLLNVFNRYFFAFDAEAVIEAVSSQCHQCASVAKVPREVGEFSTASQPSSLGISFACDVLCRAWQKVFVILDCFSSFAVSKLLLDEKGDTLKSAIIETTVDLKSAKGCIVRVDGATTFQSLVADPDYQHQGIQIGLGRLKNRNKNPVAERMCRSWNKSLEERNRIVDLSLCQSLPLLQLLLYGGM